MKSFNERCPAPRGWRDSRSALLRALGALLLGLMVSGCMTISFGFMPETDRLADLSIGHSRQGDVLLLLGQPRGKGGARDNSELDRRSIWFYEYVESDGQFARVKMLLVFFDGDVYDGHLWFSSVGERSS